MGTGILGEVVVVRGGVGGGGVYWWDPGREPSAYPVLYQVTKKFPTLYPKNIEPETPILHSTDQFPMK